MVSTSEEAEVRTLVLARALPGRMVRAANGLYEAAVQAAELCERHVARYSTAPDVADWQERGKYWRVTAECALDVIADWEAGPPTH